QTACRRTLHLLRRKRRDPPASGLGRQSHRLLSIPDRCRRCFQISLADRVSFMNGLALLAILLVSTVPLCAQDQQPDTAKLKADAQKVVSTIRSNIAKTQAYCQLNILGGQMVEAAEGKNDQKAEA